MDELKEPHRRSILLKEYDYGQPGPYFVTIGNHHREGLFGGIVEGKVVLSGFEKIVEDEWHKTKQMRQGVDLDAFIVMPNHIHGIIVLMGIPISTDRSVGARCIVPL
jgi:REP element-mobilizing transposase RayT